MNFLTAAALAWGHVNLASSGSEREEDQGATASSRQRGDGWRRSREAVTSLLGGLSSSLDTEKSSGHAAHLKSAHYSAVLKVGFDANKAIACVAMGI